MSVFLEHFILLRVYHHVNPKPIGISFLKLSNSTSNANMWDLQYQCGRKVSLVKWKIHLVCIWSLEIRVERGDW